MKKILAYTLIFLLSGVPAYAQRPIPAGGGGSASSVSIAQGGNTTQVTATAGGSLQVECTSGCGGSGGTSIADDAAFTVGTTNLTVAGGTYKSVRDSVNDNDAGAFAMTITRALYATLEDASGVAAFGTAGSSSAAVLTVQGRASMTPLQVQSNSANLATETTAAAILTSANYAAAFGTAGTADTQVMSVQGIASMTPLQVQSNSANLATETTLGGVLTSSNFAAAFGTAGSADSQVMSIQGIASMTPILVSPASGSFAQDSVFGTDTYTETTTAGPAVGFVRNDTLEALVNTNNEIGPGATTAEGALWTATSATTNGGCTTASSISTAAVMETEIKGSAGQLYALNVSSIDTTPVYIRVYNDTSAGLDESTDTPVIRAAIPAAPASDASGREIKIPDTGIAFSTGIIFRVTTGIADNSTGALSANEVLVSYCYK